MKVNNNEAPDRSMWNVVNRFEDISYQREDRNHGPYVIDSARDGGPWHPLPSLTGRRPGGGQTAEPEDTSKFHPTGSNAFPYWLVRFMCLLQPFVEQ